MWKLICLIPLLLVSSDQASVPVKSEVQQKLYGQALEAIFGIGIRLQAILEEDGVPEDTNFLVSPLSVAVSLAQLILASEGTLRDDLYYLLSLPNTTEADKTTKISFSYQSKNFSYVLPYARLHFQLGGLLRELTNSDSKDFSLSCDSAWFVNKDVKLKNEFQQNLIIYQSEIHKMNFTDDPVGSQTLINKWTADHTNQLIQTILHSPLPPTASAVFLNAVHFLAEWETPFSDELNIKGYFHVTPEKDVEVTYMRGYIDDIPYAEDKEKQIRMIGLPYKNNELTMYIIMPMEEHELKFSLKKFMETIKTNDLLNLIASAKRKQVGVTIPKFVLSSTISILQPLEKFRVYRQKQKQSINANLSGNAVDVLDQKVIDYVSFNTTEYSEIRLTGAAENGNFKLTDMIQEMTISVNEKGTEAAAVSLSIIDYILGDKTFIINRPFVFLIRHELTTATLFWGVISDPSSK